MSTFGKYHKPAKHAVFLFGMYSDVFKVNLQYLCSIYHTFEDLRSNHKICGYRLIAKSTCFHQMKLMEGKRQEKRAHKTVIVMLNQVEKKASGYKRGRKKIYI